MNRNYVLADIIPILDKLHERIISAGQSKGLAMSADSLSDTFKSFIADPTESNLAMLSDSVSGIISKIEDEDLHIAKMQSIALICLDTLVASRAQLSGQAERVHSNVVSILDNFSLL